MSLLFCYLFLSAFPVFFFNDTATTEIYTLSLHDALPIFGRAALAAASSVDLPALGNPTSPTSAIRSEEHTSELQSHSDLVCRLLLEKKKKKKLNKQKCTQLTRMYKEQTTGHRAHTL